MKKMVATISAACFLIFCAVPAFSVAAPLQPIILFADLTSGPNTGGQDNNGLFVTIVGRNFGQSRGSGSVSVGGGEAAAYPVWTSSKIAFQLGPKAKTGNITVTNASGTSNGIPFTVRSGRIFFVNASSKGNPGSGTCDDPWRSPKSYMDTMQQGDTCYFRNGLYDGQYGNNSRSYNVSFYNASAPSGSSGNEIAWVGYPGETALFKADSALVNNGAFEIVSNKQYYVIAGLSIYGRGEGREQVRLYSDNTKLVNCKIEGIKTLSYAMIGITASNLKIWGNECFGARSKNKLDHIIYFQSGGTGSNVDIGWNYIHDNDIAVGPVFSWNIGAGTSDNVIIHDNKIDCRNSSDVLRLAGIWSGSGGSITFANNIIIGAGGSLNNDDSYNAIYAAFGRINIYNNTFYQSRGAGSNFVINLFASATGEVKNNIFYNQDNVSYVKGNATIDSNLYYGGAGIPPAGDTRAVTADPQFMDSQSLDLHIRRGSPANGAGTDVTAHVKRDYDGIPRIAGNVAIGALQYYEGGSLPDVWDSNNSGTVTGINIPGTDIRLAPGEVKVIGGTISKGAVNPGKGESAAIYFQGAALGKYECRIFSLTGEIVWESSQSNISGGTFTWTPNGVASGIYLANIRGPGIRATQKIAVLQ